MKFMTRKSPISPCASMGGYVVMGLGPTPTASARKTIGHPVEKRGPRPFRRITRPRRRYIEWCGNYSRMANEYECDRQQADAPPKGGVQAIGRRGTKRTPRASAQGCIEQYQ